MPSMKHSPYNHQLSLQPRRLRLSPHTSIATNSANLRHCGSLVREQRPVPVAAPSLDGLPGYPNVSCRLFLHAYCPPLCMTQLIGTTTASEQPSRPVFVLPCAAWHYRFLCEQSTVQCVRAADSVVFRPV